MLGSYAITAEAWPSLLVQRGAAALSGSLADSLGRPAAGATLLLHRWSDGGRSTAINGLLPASPHTPSTAAVEGPQPAKPPSSPGSSQTTIAADSEPEAAPAAAGGSDAAASPLFEEVTLRLIGTLPRRGKLPAAEPRAASSQISRAQNGAGRGNGSTLTGGDWAEQELAGAGSRQRKLLGVRRPAAA